jgi:hypothetical protein
MLIIMTRWHVDDLLGRYIERFKDVKVLRYGGSGEAGQLSQVREALFPELKPLDFLLDRKRVLTEASWQSIYQQHPIVVGGGIFPVHAKVRLQVFGVLGGRGMTTGARHEIAASQGIFGLDFNEQRSGRFAPVRVNETLTILFDEDASFDSHHYAFHVSDERRRVRFDLRAHQESWAFIRQRSLESL